MTNPNQFSDPMQNRSPLPSVDHVLRLTVLEPFIDKHGRAAVLDSVRTVLSELRKEGRHRTGATDSDVAQQVASRLTRDAVSSLRPVFNLTGTVLHTNLGRAPLPEEAIEAMAAVARASANLEYDLASGRRGDRDAHTEEWLCRITGAEAATVVNNNAAAVLLVLNTLALNREVPVSRGQLIEIGGSFRMPAIMARAGCALREVGTTNRTHLSDYADAIGPDTALIMTVHTSNYVVEGFTAEVSERELAGLTESRDIPFVVDLGSGMLVDLTRYGLPHEPTVQDTLKDGADLVTFSGDKLLGGPQAGIIVGRADLIANIKRNPMKRAMRVDKMTIAALDAILRLYTDPDRLAQRLPALRLMTRPFEEIESLAQRLLPTMQNVFEGQADVEIVACRSQIGSGALPVDRLDSAGLAIRPRGGKRGRGAAPERIAASLRALPMPVITRIGDGACLMDLRCLDDEETFLKQLGELEFSEDVTP